MANSQTVSVGRANCPRLLSCAEQSGAYHFHPDRIDSRGKLFPETTAADVLDMVRGATRRGGGIAVFVRTCHESATESEGPEKNDEGDG